jgi:putative Mg2+ transporter-C (MgtC) family protein
MMDYSDVARLALALLMGGAIGFERRWQGHAAGPHTNALVAFGAALFVMMGRELGPDSVGRVEAQIATGIGFLTGGVILRDGLRVRGLNTAATIWCVAAIGAFTGMRYVGLPLLATALILVANSIFHLLEHRVPRLRQIDEEEDQGQGR